ncbi:MAG: response regulator transcription factor [Microbacterium sp.]|jgi:DNA-binding NarL/FixJ family response regulator
MTAAPAIRVLIVDDDPVVRFGLAMMLRAASDLEVAGEAGTGLDALDRVAELHPDIVLMDVRMPGMDGLTATEHLLSRPDPPGIIVLTTFDADDTVLRALRAGAAGFLLKDTPPDELVGAVRAVALGSHTLSADVTRRLIDLADTSTVRPRRAAARERLAPLAPRELEVAKEVGAGRSNAQIASRHHISLPTVKTHVSSILTKLGVASRVQIALLVQDAEFDAE